MSQFILCASEQNLSPLGCTRLQDCTENRPFLAAAAQKLVPGIPPAQLWTIRRIDGLGLAAAQALRTGRPFGNTEMHQLLTGLWQACTHILLWYAGDLDDLPTAATLQDFLCQTEHQLRDPVCEVYLRARPAQNDR